MIELLDWKIVIPILGSISAFAFRFPATYKANFGKLVVLYFFLYALLFGWILGNINMYSSLQGLLTASASEEYKTMRKDFDLLHSALLGFGIWLFFLDWISGQIIQHDKKNK